MLDICIVETLTSANRVSGQPGREYIQLLKTYVNIRNVEQTSFYVNIPKNAYTYKRLYNFYV